MRAMERVSGRTSPRQAPARQAASAEGGGDGGAVGGRVPAGPAGGGGGGAGQRRLRPPHAAVRALHQAHHLQGAPAPCAAACADARPPCFAAGPVTVPASPEAVPGQRGQRACTRLHLLGPLRLWMAAASAQVTDKAECHHHVVRVLLTSAAPVPIKGSTNSYHYIGSMNQGINCRYDSSRLRNRQTARGTAARSVSEAV